MLRLPGSKIFASDGTPMEMHPRQVDVAVTRPVGESYSGKDRSSTPRSPSCSKQIGPATKRTSAAR